MPPSFIIYYLQLGGRDLLVESVHLVGVFVGRVLDADAEEDDLATRHA